MLTAALVLVALVAGVAGSWSPCGLSMVDTLAPGACGGRRRTSVVGALAFAMGALGGGVVTFGGLALLGDRLGAGGGLAAAVAVAALLAAAVGDAAGRRIVPQVRRQVPESWRRILPVPLAAGLYGVLLGLGFTTFVLSFATWGLAALCLAVGTPATGLAIGLAFGVGRAVPVGVLAPLQDRAAFAAVAGAMGERPVILRGLRAAAAVGLLASAASLVVAPPAARAQVSPARTVANPGTDPSAADGLVAWHAGDQGFLRRGGETVPLPGGHPAVGGGRVAWLDATGTATIADPATLAPQFAYPVGDADALTLSATHLAWREGNAIYAHPLGEPPPPDFRRVATASGRTALGRPSLDGDTVVFDEQAPDASRIRADDLGTRAGVRTLRSARGAALVGPSMQDGRLLFVRSTARRQKVKLGSRTIYSTTPTARRDAGHEKGKVDHRQGYRGGRRPAKARRPPKGLTVTLWTTALDGGNAYVTRLRHRAGGRTQSRILRVR